MKYEDLQIDIYRVGPDLRNGSSAVRITHIPTGTIVKSEEAPSYKLNMKIALDAMELALADGGSYVVVTGKGGNGGSASVGGSGIAIGGNGGSNGGKGGKAFVSGNGIACDGKDGETK